MKESVIAAGGGVRPWRPAARGLLLGMMVVVGGWAAAPAAQALPVSIMLSETGYTSQTINGSSSIGSVGTFDYANSTPYVSFGTFSVQASATGSPVNPSAELLSNTIDISTETSGTLFISATETGISSPTGSAVGFLSSFTSNEVGTGLSVTESTYIDPNNGAFATTQLLGTHTFGAIGTSVQTTTLSIPSGPYSETEVFKIVALGTGHTNDSIEINPVPEPDSFAVLGVGLLGLLAFGRQGSRAGSA